MDYLNPVLMLNWLKDSLVYQYIGCDTISFGRGIRFIESAADIASEPDCIYLGSPEEVLSALTEAPLPDTPLLFLFSAGEDPDGIPERFRKLLSGFERKPRIVLLGSRLPLHALYNLMYRQLNHYLHWRTMLNDVVYTNASLQEMLDRAAGEIHGSILLLNAGFRMMAAVYHPDVKDPMSSELREKGYLSLETIEQIHAEAPAKDSDDWVEYVSRVSGNYNRVHFIRYRGAPVARLCLVRSGPEGDPYDCELIRILAGVVANYMFSRKGANYGQNAVLGSLIADLLEARLTDPEELSQRLKQVTLSIKRYFHLILISFERNQMNVGIPWNYIISQLEYLFPFSNITTYQGDIILMVRKRHRTSRLHFDETRLLEILERYNGYASVGNATEHLTSLPPLYHQNKDSLRLARRMDPEKRIIYYEDYGMYELVEMAIQSAPSRISSTNPAHLCNNEFIALALYDKKYNTDYLRILRAYLLCERNTSRAAEKLFIHRNTMLSKIHKIEEIIDASLDNDILRSRLLFSFYVLDYVERYLGDDILVLKQTSPEKRPASPE